MGHLIVAGNDHTRTLDHEQGCNHGGVTCALCDLIDLTAGRSDSSGDLFHEKDDALPCSLCWLNVHEVEPTGSKDRIRQIRVRL